MKSGRHFQEFIYAKDELSVKARQTKMSQWNALSVNVIKTRKITCEKLNLPAVLAKSPTKSPPSPKHASPEKEDLDLYNIKYKDQFTESHSSAHGFISVLPTEDILNSSVCTEDEVFQESFETPPEEESCFVKSTTKRCLSLPTYLSSEEETNFDSQVCFRPRRLFEEALNLESYSKSGQSNRVDLRQTNQYLGGYNFPRLQENIHKEKPSDTPHTERMKRTETSFLITCDNNNNSITGQNNLACTKSSFESTKHSRNAFEPRDWEQKVLVLTSDYEFGTESSKKPRDDSETRSRSVALTENISSIVNNTRAEPPTTERQAKSEENSEMPKLQTAVWNYIKRKSTKRKRKNIDAGQAPEKEHLKDSSKSANQESSASEIVRNIAAGICCNDKPSSEVKQYETNSGANFSGNDFEIFSDISEVGVN